jgi:hypothetical protein
VGGTGAESRGGEEQRAVRRYGHRSSGERRRQGRELFKSFFVAAGKYFQYFSLSKLLSTYTIFFTIAVYDPVKVLSTKSADHLYSKY